MCATGTRDAPSLAVTSRDPLNALTRSAYGYVYNNPLNNSDPSGLLCVNVTDRDCLGQIGDNLMPDDIRPVVQRMYQAARAVQNSPVTVTAALVTGVTGGHCQVNGD